MLTELKNIGLSDKEARVYIAMLELGPASVLEIAAKAAVNRPTAYVQLEALKKMGLVSTQTRGKKQLFIAGSPSQLAQLLNREEKEIEQKKDVLEKVLPDLSALFNLGGDKPVVRYFEGKEGLLVMQEEFLKAKSKEILGIFSIDAVLKLFPAPSDDYSARRIRKGIHSKIIYTSSSGPILKTADAASLRESKYLPYEKFHFNADITVFDNNVAVTSLQGKVGASLITDRNIADSFRALFDFLWQTI